MKNRIPWNLGLRLALIMVPLAGCWARQAPPPPTTPITQEPAPAPNLAEAPAVPVSAERPAPANVRTDGPVGDLIKLAVAGVNPSVLLAFATNSATPFNLNAEEVIYLNDLGVPSAVVTAILQHDKALKELPANSSAPLSPPPPGSLPLNPQPRPQAPRLPRPKPPLPPIRRPRITCPRRRTWPSPISTTPSPLTATGSRSRAPGFAGSPRPPSSTPPGNLTSTAANGSIPTADGIGPRIIRGAGPRFTTDVGFTTITGAGAGRPIQSGDRPGCVGAIPTAIAGGRRCPQAPGTDPESG